MSKVYLVMENGDDYHGSGPVRAFTKKDLAEAHADKLDREQKPCEHCGDTYTYTVSDLELD